MEEYGNLVILEVVVHVILNMVVLCCVSELTKYCTTATQQVNGESLP